SLLPIGIHHLFFLLSIHHPSRSTLFPYTTLFRSLAMGEAARLVTDVFEPEFIDINFGCPVKKVVRRNGGSGCLKDLSLVESVIRSVSASTHLPVTVKIRSGWSEETRNPVQIALRCQDAGARALALHPRTRTQMYSGSARWEE